MNPRVSVILPFSSSAGSLSETAQSILQQSLSEIELLLVSYSSKSDPADIGEKFADTRARTLSAYGEQGYSRAFNAAKAQARASYIAIASPGDIWDRSKLARQLELLASDPALGAIFSTVAADAGQDISADEPDTQYERYKQSNRSRTRWLRTLTEEGECLYHSSALIKKCVFETVGDYDEFYHHLPHYEMWLRLLQHFEIFVLAEPTIRHNRSKASCAADLTREANERRMIIERLFRQLNADDFAGSFHSLRAPGDKHFCLELEKALYLVARTDDTALMFRDMGLSLLRDFADRKQEMEAALTAYGLSPQIPGTLMGLSSPWFDRRAPFTREEREALSPLNEELGNTPPVMPAYREQPSLMPKDYPQDESRDRVCNLLVLDDCFPCELSSFRYQEFMAYLRQVEGTRVLSTGEALKTLKADEGIEAVIERFKTGHPDLDTSVSRFDPEATVAANLGYCVFLYQAEKFLPFFERNGIPFIFTLYPGGGLRLDDPECQESIRKVCASKWFRGVISTQTIVTKYLKENALCPQERITEVVGVVLPEIFENSTWIDKRQYGVNKTRIDICFAAYKYTERGEDKGYDLFVECAKRLAPRHSNVVFHVIGNFDRDDIDVSQLGPCIKFHGPLQSEELLRLYQSMDIILSPNRGQVRGGQFDGFPTGSCITAGLCGVVVFCTDLLDQNAFLTDGTDFVSIGLEPASICKKLEKFIDNPTALYWLARNGQDSFKQFFSLQTQIQPRLDLISSLLPSAQAAR